MNLNNAMPNKPAKTGAIQRRRFLKSAAAAGAGWAILPSGVLAGANAPSNKLNVALIGVWGRAEAHFSAISSENVVALCDVDEEHLAGAAKRFPRAKNYVDWRECLDQKESAKADRWARGRRGAAGRVEPSIRSS